MLKKDKKGFTLIELIVVVVVLAVLAAVAVPMISSWVEEAENSEMEANRRTLELLVQAYMAEHAIEEFLPLGPPNYPDEQTIAGPLQQYGPGIVNPTPVVGIAVLVKPDKGHYKINKFGRVTVTKATNSDDYGKIEYTHN